MFCTISGIVLSFCQLIIDLLTMILSKVICASLLETGDRRGSRARWQLLSLVLDSDVPNPGRRRSWLERHARERTLQWLRSYPPRCARRSLLCLHRANLLLC